MDFQDFEDDDELKALEEKQSRAGLMKGVLSGMGGMLQSQANVPSAYEYLYKKVGNPTDFQGTFDKMADSIQDPMDKTRKAQEYLKMKREGRLGARNEQVANAELDPSSADSKAMREQISGVFPQYAQFVEGKSKAQIKEMMPILSKKIEGDTSRENARISAGYRSQEKADARAEKAEAAQLVRDEKKKASLVEVEDRRRNIEDNLGLLEKQITDYGTYEVFGPHNNDLNRRVEMIATDMAKLADPNSVARPAEVEAFKKGLIEATATGMTNDTALSLLKSFRGELDSRVANAYKIREANDPGAQASRNGGAGGGLTPQQRAQAALERKLKAKQTAGQ